MKQPDHAERRPGRRGRSPLDYGELRLFLLAIISDRPSHGYELIKAIEERTGGHYIPSPGAIYPNLSWLEDLGLVTVQPQGGRKCYAITPEGRAFLAANRPAIGAILVRDWTVPTGDPVRAGMQALKSALATVLAGPEDPARLSAIADLLQTTARAIRESAPPRRNDTEQGISVTMEQITTRHRFDIRRRPLVVRDKTRVTPQMIRLVLAGDDLADFQSPAPDDHVKLLIDGPGGEPVMREYTPRAFDPQAGTLTIDFAVHEAGPATQWAVDAAPGDRLTVAGPRGSTVIAPVFDWWLLIGDETALPAMGRWVEGMAQGAAVTTLGLVTGPAEEQHWQTLANHVAHWCHRADPADPQAAASAVAGLDLPEGRGFVWIAAEAGVARHIRDHFLTARNHPRHWLKAAGYWTAGKADTSDKTLE